jgi:hypothetical protein
LGASDRPADISLLEITGTDFREAIALLLQRPRVN